MIRVALHDARATGLREGGIELIDAWDDSPDALIWVIFEDEEGRPLGRRVHVDGGDWRIPES